MAELPSIPDVPARLAALREEYKDPSTNEPRLCALMSEHPYREIEREVEFAAGAYSRREAEGPLSASEQRGLDRLLKAKTALDELRDEALAERQAELQEHADRARAAAVAFPSQRGDRAPGSDRGRVINNIE